MNTTILQHLSNVLGNPQNGFWRLINPTNSQREAIIRARNMGAVDMFDLTSDAGDEHGIPGDVFHYPEVTITVHLIS